MYYVDLIGGSLPDESIKNAVESLDCLSILTAFRFADAGQRKAILPFARRVVGAPDIHDRHRYWILLYELYRTGYLQSASDETGVYRVLKNNGVEFVPTLK
jgi:hypothetical protein